MESNTIPVMRGYKEAISELKAADANTNVTEYMLRKAVKEGYLPCVRIGKRDLLCMENVYNFLMNPPSTPTPVGNSTPIIEPLATLGAKTSGKIRRVF